MATQAQVAVGKVIVDAKNDATAAKTALATAGTAFQADFHQFLTDAESAGSAVASEIKSLFGITAGPTPAPVPAPVPAAATK
jgi:hypothetical protein